MKAISSLLVVIMLVLIVISIVGMSFVFFSGLFSTTTSFATNSTENIVSSMSSCMRVVSVTPNEITIRNCGEGVVESGSLTVFLDDEQISFSMDPVSIGEDEIAILSIEKDDNIQYKDYEIKISNSLLSIKEDAKFGNPRILVLGDWYSLCSLNQYLSDFITDDDQASAIPDNYTDYDIIYLRGDNNNGNAAIDESKLENFLSMGKGIFIISAACHSSHFACDDDAWFPGTTYTSGMGNKRIIDSTHYITQGYSGDYGSATCCCWASGYNGLKAGGIALTKDWGSAHPCCCCSSGACSQPSCTSSGCVNQPCENHVCVNDPLREVDAYNGVTYQTIVSEYNGARVIWEDSCGVDQAMFDKMIKWLSKSE